MPQVSEHENGRENVCVVFGQMYSGRRRRAARSRNRLFSCSDGALVITTRDALDSRGSCDSRDSQAFAGLFSEGTRRALHVGIERARPCVGRSLEILVYPGCLCVLPCARMPAHAHIVALLFSHFL